MNVEVSTTKVVSDAKRVNRGEYRATEISFNFSDEFTDLTKVAVFSQDGTSYERTIEDNKVHIPYDVLKKVGVFTLGVYGYEGEGDNLVLRYSPSPQSINVIAGSYTQDITPEDDTSRDRYLTVNNLIAGDNIYLEKEGNNVTIIGTGGGGGGGTTNYNYLNNKPQINGVELVGNKTNEDLGISTYDDTKIRQEISTLDADIEHNLELITDLGVNKQDVLIAGTNIKIENSVISATDTIYDDTEIKREISYKANESDIPKKVSDLTNDLGYQTASDVDTKIANELTNFDHLDYKVADSKPTPTEVIINGQVQQTQTGVRYLVKHITDDRYEEYILADGVIYDIGSTEEVDLSGYYNSIQVDELLDDKQPNLISGTNIKSINNTSILGSGDITTAKLNVNIDESMGYADYKVEEANKYFKFSNNNYQNGYLEMEYNENSKNAIDRLQPFTEMQLGFPRIVGEFTQDGSKYNIYEIVFKTSNLPNNTSTQYNIPGLNGISMVDIIDVFGMIDNGHIMNSGRTDNVSNVAIIQQIARSNKQIYIRTYADLSSRKATIRIKFIGKSI